MAQVDAGVYGGWPDQEAVSDERLTRFLRAQTDIFDLAQEGAQWGSLSGGFDVCRRDHLVKLAVKFHLPLDSNLPVHDFSGRGRPCMSAYMRTWWHEGRFGKEGEAESETEPEKIRRLESQVARLIQANEASLRRMAELQDMISREASLPGELAAEPSPSPPPSLSDLRWSELLGMAKRFGIDITGMKRPDVEAAIAEKADGPPSE